MHCFTTTKLRMRQGSTSADAYRRTLAQRVNDPLILAFGRAPSTSSTLGGGSAAAGSAHGDGAGGATSSAAGFWQQLLRRPVQASSFQNGGAAERSFLADAETGLSECVQLLTLKDNGDGRVLLRLAHLYQVKSTFPFGTVVGRRDEG